ncbi:MAG: DNA-protecting protein DprA [Nitrososphaerota archaeon]|jgi:DNA processing protein|nr:DNA-protecting protein DprA [Nitrososphaerota archaeon]MDG6924189.1 DNA-protecting protein DprA [Nitrososphaerota archaeon]
MPIKDISSEISTLDDIPFWLALNERSYSFPTETIDRALGHLKTISNLWGASEDNLINVGFDKKTIVALNKVKANFQLKEYQRVATNLMRNDINVIKFTDKAYPRTLLSIQGILGPPLLIFAKGQYLNFNNCVAIVGTRNCSFYGRTIARKLSKKLADKGYTIVSGLARGVDEEAHCGALESKYGRTLAVLPWLDPIYPEEHSELMKDIEQRGARLSENYAKSFGPLTPGKFVERNRITSGISKFVIAIETDVEGGTIRQAELATAQNRPIFALRPKDNERARRGHNVLITKFGAIEFSEEKDLLQKIRENKLEPERALEEYGSAPQLKLS